MTQRLNLTGVDVSYKWLSVRISGPGGEAKLEIDNTPQGHRALIRRLTKHGRSARVCLEATGTYHLDFALAAVCHPRIAVMVVNPRVMKNFAESLSPRSSTDPIAAEVALQYLMRMDFVPWTPPEPELMELRGLARRIHTLTTSVTRDKNRLHALRASAAGSALVINDVQVNLRHLQRRIDHLREQALKIIAATPRLAADFELLLTVKGIGPASAIALLAELSVLPNDMTAKQWVAHSGLDPRHHQSGTSVNKPAVISRRGNTYLRAALYMPALTARRHQTNVQAFYDKLVGRGKKPIQAVIAVMRKLLHSIWGMLHHRTAFDGDRFYVIGA